MAKTLHKRPLKAAPTKQIIPEKYQDLVYIGLIAVAVFIFFGSAIFGGGFGEFDNIASESFRNYLDESEQQDVFPLWIPYIFGGMPSFAALLTTGDRYWDIIPQIVFGFTTFVAAVFKSDAARMVCFYIFYGVGMYWLMRFKKNERFVSFITAFAAIFSTYVITWVMIGHNTKPVVFAMFPFILLFVEKLREKFSLLYLVLLTFAVHIMMEGGHLQMIFYGICAFAIYIIIELIHRTATKREPMKLVRAALLLAVAAGLAFAMSSDRYLSALEYTDYSTRGSAPISQDVNDKAGKDGALDYKYSTAWSYSPEEIINFFVPSYFGYGKHDVDGEMQYTYWGQKESEDSPPYMGIIILWMAMIGAVLYRKKPFVQFLIVLSLFALLLSFGKNLPLLYDFFYYNVPLFDKFRAPSMALAMMHFSVPLLAGFGLTGILKWTKQYSNSDKKVFLLFTGLSLLFLAVGIIINFGFKSSYLGAMATKFNIPFEQIQNVEAANLIWDNMTKDFFINAFMVLGLMALIYLFIQKKISKGLLFSLVALAVVVDLWRVDFKRMEVSDEQWQTETFAKYEPLYKPLQQEEGLFRIVDLVAPSQNIPAYFLLQNVNGYHSAKMRVYQDILDIANREGYEGNTSTLYNPFLWNLMNVKYIIAPNQQNQSQPQIYPNPQALPRAFFVNTAEIAEPMEILKHLKEGDFDPTQTAFIEEDLGTALDTLTADTKAEITEYQQQYIAADVKTAGNNLLFISEIYYPPGWKAYIDGKETKIHKINYAFRGIVVPPGEHKVEMKFHSANFETGKMLSIIVNILTILAGIFGAYLLWKEKNSKKDSPEPQA